VTPGELVHHVMDAFTNHAERVARWKLDSKYRVLRGMRDGMKHIGLLRQPLDII
jgi:hypothetical protein